MTPEEALEKLIEALAVVRKRFDEGTDDWRYSLLRTWREYSRAVGIERRLLDPLELMVLEAADATDKVRRKRERKAVNRMSVPKSAVMIIAAASVFVLKSRGDYATGEEAEKAVVRATRLKHKVLHNFCHNIESWNYSDAVMQRYKESIAEIQTWPEADMLEAIKGLSTTFLR